MPATPRENPALNRCPICGDSWPTDWSGSGCPRCLVQIAIDWPSRNAPGGPVQPPDIELLRDRFPSLEIVSLIGCGGMGAVYEARQPYLDRSIALKILPVERARDVIAVERFRRESRVLAQLDHPNIVRIYDSGQEGDLFFLIMEFVDGANLRDILASGPVPAGEIRQIAIQLCAAIQAAHDLGCIHRDLKPENILLDDSGRVKITDFGIARWAGERDSDDSLTTASVRIGTPRYMAPEQRDTTGKTDHRADLFALGIILYELLTGRPPQLEYRSPSHVSGADRRWDRIVARCLKSAPNQRYQSAQELADEIRRLIPTKPSPTHRRRQWFYLSLPLLFLGTAVSLAIPLTQSGNTGRPRSAGGSIGPVRQAAAAVAPLVAGTPPDMTPAPDASREGSSAPAPSDPVSEPAQPVPLSHPTPPDEHPLISARWTWSPLENLGNGINTPDHESHPTISADGLTLLFVRDFTSVWQSRRSSVDEPFPTAHRLPGPINDDGPTDSPFLSKDGLTVWFASSRPGSLGTLGRNDLWEAHRPSLDAPFDAPVSLGSTINTPWEESTPYVTDDGLQLYFCVRRPYSSSLADLFVATRDRVDAPFSDPGQIGGNLNGPGNDFFPRLADNGRILFYTTTNPETRDQKLHIAVRPSPTDRFRALPDPPPVINSGIVSAAALFADDRRIIFDSNRDGGHGGFDLWTSTRIPAQASPRN